MDQSPKILFVTAYYPFPANSGGRIATTETIRALKAMGYGVEVISLAPPPPNLRPEDNMPGVSVKVGDAVVTSKRRFYLIADLLRGELREFTFRRSNMVKRHLEETLATHKFSAVICDHLSPSVFYPEFRTAGCPIYYRAHNVESDIEFKIGVLDNNAFTRFHRTIRVWLQEAWFVSKVDGVLAISDVVLKKLRRFSGRKAHHCVLPVSLEAIGRRQAFSPSPLPEQPELLFVGSLSWEPNRVAMQWFLEEVYPRLSHSIPLVIATRERASKIEELAKSFSRVSFYEGEDLRASFKRASVAILPMKTGSGLKIKALEATVALRPIVSTPRGVEGLPLRNGRDVLISNSASDFAASIDRLTLDRAFSRTLAENAFQTLKSDFSDASVSRSLASLLNRSSDIQLVEADNTRLTLP